MIKTRINDNWEFSRYGETSWQNVCLPHDAMILEKQIPDLENGPAMGFYPGGKYVYTKTLYADPDWEGKMVLLEFEGVYMDSHVLLNGQEIGGRFYGYSNFFVDLTGKLNIGWENEIRVIVDNSRQPNSRWYSGSGIYRSVNLWVGGSASILPEAIRVKTVSTVPPVVQVTVDADMTDSRYLVLEVLDGQQLLARAEGSKTEIELPNARLWSSDSPALYTLRATLFEGDTLLDVAETRFGIRSLSWNAEKGFQVNGQTIKLKGGCIHHDHGILGAASYDKAERRRVENMKSMGFNAIRYAHNPVGKNLLDICDELGVYVIEEAFDQWKETQTANDYALNFDEEWQRDINSMVSKDYNHPCVVMYSVGNEITDVSLPTGGEICKKLCAYVKTLDDTRPTSLAVNTFLASIVYEQAKKGVTDFFGSQQVNEIVTLIPKIMANSTPEYIESIIGDCAKAVDIMGYNYSHWLYEGTHAMIPDRVILSSETYPCEMASNWNTAMTHPYVIGDFHWAAWDYLGEAGVGLPVYGTTQAPFSKEYPCRTAAVGSFDLTGFPETAAYYNAILWDAWEGVHMAVRPVTHSGEEYTLGKWRLSDSIPSWTWPGCEGKTAQVEVYGRGDSAQLFLNGNIVGSSSLENCRAVFELPYEAGTLTAKVLDESGMILAETSLQTAGTRRYLSVLPEEHTVKAGEIVFVPIHLTDENGTMCMTEDVPVTVRVQGGSLLALGSACPDTTESYQSDIFTSYHGRVLAVVRAGEEGKVTVTASSRLTQPAFAEIEIQ